MDQLVDVLSPPYTFRLGNADGLRASKLEHPVQGMNGDVYGLICDHSQAAGPDEVRGSGPIQGGALEARCCTLVFLIPSHRPLRHPSPSTFLRPNSPTDASAYTLT